MTRDELVEKVARVLCKSQGEMEAAWVFYCKDARAAIRIALEEAAKVAVAPCPVVPHPRECERCSNSKLKYRSPRAAAAALRAMIPGQN